MAVSVHQLSYKYPYGTRWAVDKVDFEIRPGETVQLTGRSGSGKSTIGCILSGVMPHLYKGGELAGETADPEGGKVQAGMVTQIPENQLFGYKVEDAIVFGMENLGLDRDEMDRRLNRVIGMLNIGHLIGRPVGSLSGGQKQIVCIASVLAMQPKLLIMDEPVGSLDPAGKALVCEVLRQLKDAGQTVLLIDQNLDWSIDVVDRVLGMEEGRLVFDGTPEQLLRDSGMIRRLGVEVPQTVELYHALRRGSDIPFFASIDDAERLLKARFPDMRARHSGDAAGGAPDSGPSVQIEALVKDYDGFRALDGVDAAFMPGRVTALLGQNGSGKTTLVRHLIGLVRPTSGEIRYRGASIADRSTAELARSVAYVFQHPDQMIFEDKVLDELTFSARTMGIPWTVEQAEELLGEYGLTDLKDAFPNTLPMGIKHMLTILSVLPADPDVVILDEPTLGMDSEMKAKLAALLKRLASGGKTVIVISHEMPFVAETADDILVLKDGRVLARGAAAEVFRQEELLRRAMIEPPQIARLARRLGLDGVLTTGRLLECLSRGHSLQSEGMPT